MLREGESARRHWVVGTGGARARSPKAQVELTESHSPTRR